MVLNIQPPTRIEERGQVIILAAVAIALIILSAVIIVNASFIASQDVADGVERTTPETLSIVDDFETNAQSAITQYNRQGEGSFSSLFDDVRSTYEQSASHNAQTVEIEKTGVVEGYRFYGSYTPDTTDNESTVVSGLGEDTIGSLSVDMENTSGVSSSTPFTIEYDSNEIEMYCTETDCAPGSDVVVSITNGEDSDTYTIGSESETTHIDLGKGTVNGFELAEYELSSTSKSLEVSNSEEGTNSVHWSADLVSKEDAVTEVDNFESTDAVYGVAYNVEIQSQRSHVQTSRYVTYGSM